MSVDNLREACLQLVVCARARARELQVDVQVERASRAVVAANTVTPTKGRTTPAMEPAVCKFFLTAEGCKFGDECRYKHPRTTGKCIRCGADGHSLSSCTRPSKSKSGSQPKQSTKGKGRSTPTPTSAKPSSSAKPKAQPKKNGAKGGGKGKKDKSSAKSSTKSSAKPSAKAGEVSFDNDDAEEENLDAEYDWGEEDEDVAEEEQVETFADHAFATPYHSHVCAVHDLDAGGMEPMGSTAIPGELQMEATSEEHWTTDDDAIDTPGQTRTPNSQEAQRGPLSRQVPSEQARNAAAAVMRANFPTMLAEMNPDWAPLTAHDLLHCSDDSSDSVELLTSEEEEPALGFGGQRWFPEHSKSDDLSSTSAWRWWC